MGNIIELRNRLRQAEYEEREKERAAQLVRSDVCVKDGDTMMFLLYGIGHFLKTL